MLEGPPSVTNLGGAAPSSSDEQAIASAPAAPSASAEHGEWRDDGGSFDLLRSDDVVEDDLDPPSVIAREEAPDAELASAPRPPREARPRVVDESVGPVSRSIVTSTVDESSRRSFASA